jgi:hypothetical protein
MMPLEMDLAVCQGSALLADQCRRELTRLQMSSIEAFAYNKAARSFLQTAGWIPPRHYGKARPAELDSLPVVRGEDSGWNKRAEETRLFAEKVKDAALKRELMAIAELYGSLAGAGPACRASSGIGAIAA